METQRVIGKRITAIHQSRIHNYSGAFLGHAIDNIVLDDGTEIRLHVMLTGQGYAVGGEVVTAAEQPKGGSLAGLCRMCGKRFQPKDLIDGFCLDCFPE